MRVLLDTNVILDAMLQRAPWHQEADAILQAAANGQVTCAATTLTLATTFYVGRKAVGNAAARAAVRRYLGAFTILPADKQTPPGRRRFAWQRFRGQHSDCRRRYCRTGRHRHPQCS